MRNDYLYLYLSALHDVVDNEGQKGGPEGLAGKWTDGESVLLVVSLDHLTVDMLLTVARLLGMLLSRHLVPQGHGCSATLVHML